MFAFFLHILFHLIFGSPITTSDLFPKTTCKFFIRMLFTLGQIIRIGLVDGTDNRRKIVCRTFTPSVTLHIFPRQTSLGYHFVDVVVGLLLFLFPTVPFERIDTAGYRRDLFRLSLGIELQQLVIVFEQYGLAGINSMDVCLPMIVRSSYKGEELIPIAILHGIALEVSVPFLINAFC